MSLAVELDVPLNPADVCVLRPWAVMKGPHLVSHLVQQPSWSWFPCNVTHAPLPAITGLPLLYVSPAIANESSRTDPNAHDQPTNGSRRLQRVQPVFRASNRLIRSRAVLGGEPS